MTKLDYTALVFVVDHSGSMFFIAQEMSGGISALIREQAELPGDLTVDLVQFDNYSEYLYTLAKPEEVIYNLIPRGSTALHDAVGLTIDTFGATLADMPEEERPSKVLFVIVTDGLENASRVYTAENVKERIERQTETYGWEFIYLGANQDAVTVAGNMGIPLASALTYNTADVSSMTSSVSGYLTTTRSLGTASFTDEDRAKNS